MLRSFAKHLARTKYGQRALATDADLAAFRQKPSPRLCFGLGLIVSSYLTGWVALTMGGILALEGEATLTLAAGGVALFVLVHTMFAAGVWLAGANYAATLLHWLTRRFLLTHLDG